MTGIFDDHRLHPQAQPQRGDAVGARVVERADLAVDPTYSEPSRHNDRIDLLELLCGPVRAGAEIGLDPAQVHLRAVMEAAGPQRLGDREVGVRQVDVLADQSDADLVVGVVDPLQQFLPLRPVHIVAEQVQAADGIGIQPLPVQHSRDLVDRRGISTGDHGIEIHIAHRGDLRLHRGGQLAVAAQHDRIGLDADRAQSRHGVLGGLGLQLLRRTDERHQGDVDEEHAVPTHVLTHLASRLEERLGLDIADGPADLGDDDIDIVPCLGAHRGLDRVGDVRDHLDGVAEILTPAFLRDHRGVDLAGGDVRVRGEALVEEPLVVSDVQIGLGAVLGDEHLTVLERVHGARVHVEIRVELLHRHPQSATAQQHPERRCCQPLAEARDDAAGHEDVLGGAEISEGLGRCGRPLSLKGAVVRLGGARAGSFHGPPIYQWRGPGASTSSSWASRSSAVGSSSARRRAACSAALRSTGSCRVVIAAASAAGSPTGTR